MHLEVTTRSMGRKKVSGTRRKARPNGQGERDKEKLSVEVACESKSYWKEIELGVGATSRVYERCVYRHT